MLTRFNFLRNKSKKSNMRKIESLSIVFLFDATKVSHIF